MSIYDAYEALLIFYDLKIIENKFNSCLTTYQLIDNNGICLDSIERETKIQAIQEFSRRLKNGIYSSIFVASRNSCEVK